MDLTKIETLLEMVKKSGLSKFSYKEGDFEICLEKTEQEGSVSLNQGSACFVEAPVEFFPKHTVRAPMIGIFYRSKKPQEPPFVQEGDLVLEGDVVGLVEAMKTFFEVKSTVSGKIAKICVQDLERVDLNSVIIEVEKV